MPEQEVGGVLRQQAALRNACGLRILLGAPLFPLRTYSFIERANPVKAPVAAPSTGTTVFQMFCPLRAAIPAPRSTPLAPPLTTPVTNSAISAGSSERLSRFLRMIS